MSITFAQKSDKAFDHLFSTPLNYTAYKASVALSIDGKAQENDWHKAPWSTNFIDIEGASKATPAFNTRFKMLWNDSCLYVYTELEEPHVWATITAHDEIIYHDNDFEIFIDPDGDCHQYFEIEINAFATVFDLFMHKPYRNGGLALIPWNAEGLRVKTYVDGTINDPSDSDKKWTIEMAIPFKSLSLGNHIQIPNHGTIWRMNFSRVQWDMEVKEGSYHKVKDPETKKPLSEHNWVWSPQGAVNMHMPERWGYVRFSDEQPGASHTPFDLPEETVLKNQLWLIYYSQARYFGQHGRFASDLEGLGVEKKLSHSGHDCEVKMESTMQLFLATLECEVLKEAWQIDNKGHIQRIWKKNL